MMRLLKKHSPMKHPIQPVAFAILLTQLSGEGSAQSRPNYPQLTPDAIVNLRTTEGANVLEAKWAYREASIVPSTNKLPGPDGKPTGDEVATFDISPRLDSDDFKTGAWQSIEASSLETRRSPGKLSFGWYKINLTLPEQIGSTNVNGGTAVLELVVDDYAEISVNGTLTTTLGSDGGQLVEGWNAPNRIVLTRNATAGQTFEIAVLAANGPFSRTPSNYVWVRSVSLELYAPEKMPVGEVVPLEIDRKDPRLDEIITSDSRLEKLASGFRFIEGPVWNTEGQYLLFSDPNNNTIYRWDEANGVSVYRVKSGYTGLDIGRYSQPGSNGLTFDSEGRLTIAEHGNRRITRLEKNGTLNVISDKVNDKRLNSPNDLVFRSDGVLYFTDPPFGLPAYYDDPARELSSTPVCMVRDGKTTIVSEDLKGPNGIAFSPDESVLYVSNWDEARKIIMRYKVHEDGTLSDGSVFFDMTDAPGAEALDGLKVDQSGNVYSSGPGGLWIIAADGTHLGTLRLPELAANFAWGGTDAKTLYVTARTGLYRLNLKQAGAGMIHPKQ